MPVINNILQNATSVIPPPDITPLVEATNKFFTVMSTLLGGLFGLYFIFLLLRFFYDRKILKEVRHLRADIHHLGNMVEVKNERKH